MQVWGRGECGFLKFSVKKPLIPNFQLLINLYLCNCEFYVKCCAARMARK